MKNSYRMNEDEVNKAQEDIPRLLITPQIIETIQNQDASDPVWAQYYPTDNERIIHLNETSDPIGDHTHSPVTGIVHRHADRALLKITDSCAVYCRFCFRKEMVGKGAGILNDRQLDQAIDYIQNTPELREIIFTGGDPLTLSNRRLKEILDRLNQIDHLDIIRFHTRTPLVNPSRVDDDFIELINSSENPVYIVFHVNHVQEINQAVKDMFKQLSCSTAVLLSQSVLLKTINNTAADLEHLFRTLIQNRVKPYYLHHPDLAPGTSHFRVSIKQGQDIFKQLQGKLSGLCLPTYVLDIPDGYGKVPINHNYLNEVTPSYYIVEDHDARQHDYKE